LYWGYIGTFTKCLQYIVVKFTPSIILLYSLLIPRIVSAGLIVPFSYTST
jgi:hypothetical protein